MMLFFPLISLGITPQWIFSLPLEGFWVVKVPDVCSWARFGFQYTPTRRFHLFSYIESVTFLSVTFSCISSPDTPPEHQGHIFQLPSKSHGHQKNKYLRENLWSFCPNLVSLSRKAPSCSSREATVLAAACDTSPPAPSTLSPSPSPVDSASETDSSSRCYTMALPACHPTGRPNDPSVPRWSVLLSSHWPFKIIKQILL